MENTTIENQPVNNQVQVPLPNSTAILVLGILSIVVCWCYGIFGTTMGIIALVLSKKAKALYNETPEKFTITSLKNLNAGRVCAIIGTALSGLYIVYVLIIVVFLGAVLTQMPWENFI
ncbi:MAG: hypothetical protein MI739_07410 [Bacteroidales bacterium]|nr:hypothetical protein [Bacteroidales bacterium]